MIQRKQSVFLLLAAVLMAVFVFVPALSVPLAEGGRYDVGALCAGATSVLHIDPLLLPLCVLVPVVAVITIFKYKNRMKQMTLCTVNILLVLALITAILILAFVSLGKLAEGPFWTFLTWWDLLPVAALVMIICARRSIWQDEKLVRDSERLRG